MERRLDNIPFEEARRKFISELEAQGFLKPLEGAEEDIADCIGRVTAKPVFAGVSSPHFRAAAMDGIAVAAKDTFMASENRPLLLEEGKAAVRVDTGDPVPDEFDAVIMLEDISEEENNFKIYSPVPPGRDVRQVGEDFAAGELLFPVNHRLRPWDIGVIAAAGHSTVNVRRRPSVAVITTGTELVVPGMGLLPGQIIDSNAPMLSGIFSEWGCSVRIYPRVPDDLGRITTAVRTVLEGSDLVVVNAGSSAGSEDFVADAVKALGRVVVHGVNTKPGKPVVLGICGGNAVVGVPGYPVSAALACELYLKPIIDILTGEIQKEPTTLEAVLTRKISSSLGKEEFVRVACARFGRDYGAVPLGRGASKAFALALSSGYICIPGDMEGMHPGDRVMVRLNGPDLKEIDCSVIIAGSALPALESLKDFVSEKRRPLNLVHIKTAPETALWMLREGAVHGAALVETDLPGKEVGPEWCRFRLANQADGEACVLLLRRDIVDEKNLDLLEKTIEEMDR